MKKIIWFLVILLTIFGLLIYKVPSVAIQIENILGIKGFSEKASSAKTTFDGIVTNVPTKEEVQSAYSGALEKVDEAKEKIDDIRVKAGEYEDKYDRATEFIENASDKIDQAKDTIDSLKGLVGTGVLETNSGTVD